jgi:effector-binding domain-containing protein
MSKTKCLLVLLFVAVTIGIVVELFAGQPAEESAFSIRKLESQIVLYTVYRGPYGKIGKPIGELFVMAAQKRIIPRGPVSLVYLNNPYATSQDSTGKHCLTEIRIQVGEEAMQQAGTLGAMTDVKTLKPTEVAVVKKQIGQMSYDALFENLYERIAQEGYRPIDDAFEVFAGSMMSSDYSQAKSEIMVPVAKIEQVKK